MSDFLPLTLSALLFVGGHLLLSAAPIRDRLVGALGETLFIPAYATLAFASLGAMIWTWSQAPAVWLWQGPRALAWVPLVTMPVAFLLLVESLTRKNPTAVYQGSVPVSVAPQGAFAITRHPGMWGFALWAASHLVVNGDLASLIMMGSVLMLALAGTAHIDARRRAKLGPSWRDYAKHTSWLPFAAMAQGRARFRPREIGWWRPLLALVLYAGILHLHTRLIGVSPLP